MGESSGSDISSIPEDLKYRIFYEWVHYNYTFDELAKKYGLTWDQIFEIVKTTPTRYAWIKPKEFTPK
jgi:Mor family transcriptional regulator